MTDIATLPVDQAGLSTRTTNSLMRGGYYSMGDVCRSPAYELLRLPEFGRKSLNEIEAWAAERGFCAGEARWRMERQLRVLEERQAILARDIAELTKRLAL